MWLEFQVAPSQGDSLSELSSTDISALLQSLKKWTSEHLDPLKVKLIEDVPVAELTGNYAPKDGDAGTMYSTTRMVLYPEIPTY